jgi:hypothetical protein
VSVVVGLLAWACGGDSADREHPLKDSSDPDASTAHHAGQDGQGRSERDGGADDPAADAATSNPLQHPSDGPAAGNPDGHCDVPDDARAEDSSAPTHVIGDGSAASCTSQAVVDAIAKGGVITFDCGSDPLQIELEETAKIFNDTGPKIVIDGGGKITLSGAGKRRILYMNTCDQAQHFTTSHCDDQDHPQLTVQNLTFVDGNADGAQPEGGGGAIFASGGRLKIVNSRFFRNRGTQAGPDVAGGAVRAFQQSMGLPLYVVNSTFGGGDGLGNSCSSGGALGSIGVSYTVLNSVLSDNQATGNDASGGGNGGAIGNDGNTYTLEICGSLLEHNHANEGGGGIFYVSNDMSGTLIIRDSKLDHNVSAGYETMPGIFSKTKGDPQIIDSTIE